eukprot:scaffold100326_cov31-Tisochrysis_lutea.AAC.4
MRSGRSNADAVAGWQNLGPMQYTSLEGSRQISLLSASTGHPPARAHCPVSGLGLPSALPLAQAGWADGSLSSSEHTLASYLGTRRRRRQSHVASQRELCTLQSMSQWPSVDDAQPSSPTRQTTAVRRTLHCTDPPCGDQRGSAGRHAAMRQQTQHRPIQPPKLLEAHRDVLLPFPPRNDAGCDPSSPQ